MSKITLDLHVIEKEFFAERRLVGIAAPATPDYRFCWILNHYLGMQFERKPDWDISSELMVSKKVTYSDLFAQINFGFPDQQFYSVYQHIVQGSELSVLLYNNQSEGNRLIQEMKSVDFFILFPDNASIPEFEKIFSCRQLSCVTWFKEIDWKYLASRSAFVL